MSSNPQDLTPQARIRHAAVDLFGSQGFDKTTIRQIASRAGVSPGLVIHHYGSKNALRQACDDWVVEILLSEKQLLMVGPMPAMTDYVEQHPELAGVMAYLVAALREGGDLARTIFQRLLGLTDEMLVSAQAQGVVRPIADRGGVAAILVAMSCGLMLLEPEVAARLGGGSLTEPAVVRRYTAAALELFAQPLFTDAYTEALRAAVDPTSSEGKE